MKVLVLEIDTGNARAMDEDLIDQRVLLEIDESIIDVFRAVKMGTTDGDVVNFERASVTAIDELRSIVWNPL